MIFEGTCGILVQEETKGFQKDNFLMHSNDPLHSINKTTAYLKKIILKDIHLMK